MDPLLESLRQRAASLPEVRLAVLFGSTARGESNRQSDVDLGLVLKPDSLKMRFKVEAELERAAGKAVHAVYLGEAPPLLRFEISRDGLLLVEREDGLWTDFKTKAMVEWWDWAPIAKRIEDAAVKRLREKVEHGQA